MKKKKEVEKMGGETRARASAWPKPRANLDRIWKLEFHIELHGRALHVSISLFGHRYPQQNGTWSC